MRRKPHLTTCDQPAAAPNPTMQNPRCKKAFGAAWKRDALYWAAELAGWNPESLWKRLRVPSPVKTLDWLLHHRALTALYENWRDAQKDGEGEKDVYSSRTLY